MDKIVKAVFPDFPDDRNVAPSRDVMSWYKINAATRTLLVPPMNIIRGNMMELERFAEAVKAFATADVDSSMYDWSENCLSLNTAVGADIIPALKKLHDLALQYSDNGLIACDIETRRIEWEDNKLLSIGFAYGPNNVLACYDFSDDCSEIYAAMQELFNDKDLTFCWHNGKFDCGRLKYLCNLKARIDEDTMLQHYMCINEKQGTHGLKALGQLYLQAPAWDDELDNIKRAWCKEHRKTLKEFMYDDIPTSVLIPYMQRDCLATYRLNLKFKSIAREGSEFMYRQLIRAANVYGQIELAGQRLDLDYLEELEVELDNKIKVGSDHLLEVSQKVWDPLLYAAETGAKAKVGDVFNPKSPKQLKWMLKEVLGHPVPSTDAVTMQGLLSEVEQGYIQSDVAKEFIEAIGDVRKYSKYLETYALGMRDVVCGDSRVRCTFNLHGTETGRLSSSGPNMQNIPRNKMIKNLIVATPGYKFLQLDYSQAELRVLAMLSGDPFMCQVYKDGKDLHDAVATDMFGPNFDKEQRNLAKTINFGIAYGRGPSSIAEKFGKSMAEARQIIEKWFAPMPKVREFINYRRKMATRGEPCVTLLGRERHFVITNEEINHIQNEYINTPIQSLASDFTMLSLMDIYDYLQEQWPDVARITTTVHDSIILEVRDGDPDMMLQIAKTCLNIMATTPLKYVPECDVPFIADAEIGYKWGEMYKMDMNTGTEKQED